MQNCQNTTGPDSETKKTLFSHIYYNSTKSPKSPRRTASVGKISKEYTTAEHKHTSWFTEVNIQGEKFFLLTSCIHLSPALQCASHLGHIYTFSPMTAADCSFPARISFQKDWLTGSSLFTFWKKNIPRSRSSYFQSSKNSRDIKKTKLTSCHWSQTLWQGERRLRPWCRLSGFIPRGAVFKRSPWVSEKLDTRLLDRALESRCMGWRVPSIVVLQQQPTRKTREALKNERTGNGRKRMFSHMVATSTWLLVTHST